MSIAVFLLIAGGLRSSTRQLFAAAALATLGAILVVAGGLVARARRGPTIPSAPVAVPTPAGLPQGSFVLYVPAQQPPAGPST